MSVSLRDHLNWQKLIEQVTDPYLLIHIALRADESQLERMRAAYPLCFRDGVAKRSGPFPLSFLRQLFVLHCQEDESDGSDFNDAGGLKQIGFPTVLCAPATSEYAEGALLMPPAIVDRYQAILAAVNGDYFPRKLFRLSVDGDAYYVGWVDRDGNGGNTRHYDITLFPAALVHVDTDDAVIDV